MPQYPRILIVGAEPFEYVTGRGITLSNFFKGWPRDRIACVHSSSMNPATDVCADYFRLGREELGWAFPLSLVMALPRLRAMAEAPAVSSVYDGCGTTSPGRRTRTLPKRLRSLASGFGLGAARRVLLSRCFRTWLRKHRSDVVYSTPTSLSDICAADSISRFVGAGIVVHMYDDWVQHAKPNASSRLLAPFVEHRLKRLFAASVLTLAIGKAMSKAYESRYGRSFPHFQNCPDARIWLDHQRSNWRVGAEFRLVFTGMVYQSCNAKSLKELATAVSYLNRTARVRIQLDIHTSAAQAETARRLMGESDEMRIGVAPPEQEEVARLYGSADALILAFDFDPAAEALSRFSMPTKLPAYMLSGAPVFVYAPASSAALRFLVEADAAYVVDRHCSSEQLAGHLLRFCTDEPLRERLAINASRVALSELSAETVRPRFQSLLLETFAGIKSASGRLSTGHEAQDRDPT